MAEKIHQVKIEESWKEVLKEEFQQPYFVGIKSFLVEQKQQNKIIYPPGSLIFNAFDSTPFDKVKVVILGQDPYHGPGQAMGLSFSVPKNTAVPRSLENIYKELANNFDDFTIPKHGDLSNWAAQGVFLLNAMLTVEHRKPSSHAKIGWQQFTDAVIKKLSDERQGLIFMLWGNFAKSKKLLIDPTKHHILEAAHPSPFSAHSGFFGCEHFKMANKLLKANGKTPINWQV